MKSPEYQKGYSAGYMARIKAHRPPPTPPQPDWVRAVTELAERLGRESFSKICREIANAHAAKLSSEAAKHAPAINEAELLAAMHATVEPILARIEGANSEGSQPGGPAQSAGGR